MRTDRITELEVEICIEQADAVAPDILGRTSYTKRHHEGTLHVIAIEEDGDQVVITVILKREATMKITYDSEADALYIWLREVRAVDAIDIEDGVTVEVDEDGHIRGIELLDASKRLSHEELTKLSYENLVSEKKAALKLP
jgi:uncharacterized protein YuzE